ncbi:MAG: hypothetical protein DIU67_006935 [Actinomycetes bacterium]|jgi:ABC-type transport system substrate-binding protein
MSKLRRVVALALLGAVIAACGTEGGSPATTIAPPETTTTTTGEATTTTPSTTIGDTVPGNTLQRMIEKAKADLVQRLKVPESEITVMRAEAVTWPDGSMGCPQPGMNYTQALVEGYQVVLGVGNKAYDYHAGGDGEPFFCPSDEEDGGHSFVPPPGYDK